MFRCTVVFWLIMKLKGGKKEGNPSHIYFLFLSDFWV